MHIERAKIVSLITDMAKWRGLAYKNYQQALNVKDGYISKFESGAYSSMTSASDAEARAASDTRFVNAIANNVMYDRFTTRDAAVLTALASLVTAGLLEVRD